MLLIYGTSLYGKCDEVPGLFHVATNFVHLYYIPLVPTGSHVVLAKRGSTWQGAPCGLSVKSLLMGWLRAVAIVAILICFGASLMLYSETDYHTMAMFAAVGVAAAFFLIWSYRAGVVCRASYRRAMILADKIGLSDEGKIMIDLAFGKVTQEEVNAMFAELESTETEALETSEQSRSA